MYYIYLKQSDKSGNPDKIIVFYDGNYFERQRRTDWDLMNDRERLALENGSDKHYYSIDESQFHDILRRWGGSRYGYRNQNLHIKENEK